MNCRLGHVAVYGRDLDGYTAATESDPGVIESWHGVDEFLYRLTESDVNRDVKMRSRYLCEECHWLKTFSFLVSAMKS